MESGRPPVGSPSADEGQGEYCHRPEWQRRGGPRGQRGAPVPKTRAGLPSSPLPGLGRGFNRGADCRMARH
jgi:hypothetical protein